MPENVAPVGTGWHPVPHFYAPPPIASTGSTGARSVGIVLRTRDRPLLLDRALAGIGRQTHDAWRIHLVNDGGDPVALAAVLAQHAETLEGRLDLVHRGPPHGMAAATQAGLERVTEDLIAVHDDDDTWEPGFLAAVTGFLSDPAHARYVGVATDCTLVEEEIIEDRVVERWRCPWPHARGTLDLRQALVEVQVPPISMAFRRAALPLCGGFDPAIQFSSDYEFLLRLLLVGEVGHIDAPLANYHHRVRGSGRTYGNSVVEWQQERAPQAVLLRNAMLRTGLRGRPETAGLLQAVLVAVAEAVPAPDVAAAILPAIERAAAAQAGAAEAAAADASARADALLAEIAALRRETAARLDRMEAELRAAASWQRQVLRPLDVLWRGALPARRVLARLRGRGPRPP